MKYLPIQDPFKDLDTPTTKTIAPQAKENLAPKASVIRPNLIVNSLLRKKFQNINGHNISSNQPNVKAPAPSTQYSNIESQEPKHLFQINMELAPGISVEILVYENSDPVQLAEEFGIEHCFKVTDAAKANIARVTDQLLTAKKKAILGL